jgi:hypothetical protein
MILRRHHRKLFFPFGLLTLGLLHLVLIHRVQKGLQLHNYQGVEINLLPEQYWKAQTRNHPNVEIPPVGPWKSFRFTRCDTVNIAILINLKNEINQFLLRRDTSEGIRIEFERETSYDTFVHIMDLLIQCGADRYTHFNHAIWLPKYSATWATSNFSDVVTTTYLGTGSMPVFADSVVAHDHVYHQRSKSALPIPILLLLLAYCILNFYQVYRYHQLMLACRLTSRSS